MSGTCYIVSTPIGNLKDITYRAVITLKSVDVILAEDTRKAKILLNAYEIAPKRIISYHSQNEKQRLNQVLEILNSGEEVALISEAGTPLISDPGFLLVKELAKNEIPVVTIPGVTALTALLPLSAFPLGSFYFGGFLSPKSGRRKNQLKKLLELETTLVFYESPYRVLKTLADMKEVFGGEREVVLGRELTKKFEEVIRGTLNELCREESDPAFLVKGEFCVILNNNS